MAIQGDVARPASPGSPGFARVRRRESGEGLPWGDRAGAPDWEAIGRFQQGECRSATRGGWAADVRRFFATLLGRLRLRGTRARKRARRRRFIVRRRRGRAGQRASIPAGQSLLSARGGSSEPYDVFKKEAPRQCQISFAQCIAASRTIDTIIAHISPAIKRVVKRPVLSYSLGVSENFTYQRIHGAA